MSRPVWRTAVEETAFREETCGHCFQVDEARKRVTDDGPGCPHLARAAEGKLPKAWTYRRTATMGSTYRCADFTNKPASNQRKTAPADTPPMLDPEPTDRNLVPVDGWPDYRAEERKQQEGDHQ